jgi:hypothetical protein
MIRKFVMMALSVTALAGCADLANEAGLRPGDIKPGPSMPLTDAPAGTVIKATNGTILDRTPGGWLITSRYGTAVALNPIWWTDKDPVTYGLHPIEPIGAVKAKLAALDTLKPGAQVSLLAEGENNPAGTTVTMTVLGSEEVDVPAGHFTTMHIRRFNSSNCANCGNWSTFNVQQDLWFVPATGVVKYDAEMLSGLTAPQHEHWEAAKIERQ